MCLRNNSYAIQRIIGEAFNDYELFYICYIHVYVYKPI